MDHVLISFIESNAEIYVSLMLAVAHLNMLLLRCPLSCPSLEGFILLLDDESTFTLQWPLSLKKLLTDDYENQFPLKLCCSCTQNDPDATEVVES